MEGTGESQRRYANTVAASWVGMRRNFNQNTIMKIME
jgi:hypothetical protein